MPEVGVKVDMIAGFRDKDLIILENEMREASDNGYSHTNVCNSTFAEGPGEDSFYYIYKFQKSANTAP